MSKNQKATLACILTYALASNAAAATEVAICTDLGRIVVELNREAAPLHSANFLRNVGKGYYTGTVFHRVIDDFMIQAGGYTRNLEPRVPVATVQNESRNGLSNDRGTIAAARTADPDSAAGQFFINTVNNRRLNASRSDWGYTVFGAVTEGMDVVDRIGGLPTGAAGPFADDVPEPLVAILNAAVLDREALASVEGPVLQAALLARVDVAEETDSPETALEWISNYRATCAPAGSDLLVTEARHATAVELHDRARYALEEFFATASSDHRDYNEAEFLYSNLPTDNLRAAGLNACSAPVVPEIPDGEEESLEGMLAAQSAVQTYMEASDDYLECMDEIIDSDDTPADTRTALIETYNRAVDLAQQVGDDFNAQVRAFRARE